MSGSRRGIQQETGFSSMIHGEEIKARPGIYNILYILTSAFILMAIFSSLCHTDAQIHTLFSIIIIITQTHLNKKTEKITHTIFTNKYINLLKRCLCCCSRYSFHHIGLAVVILSWKFVYSILVYKHTCNNIKHIKNIFSEKNGIHIFYLLLSRKKP